MTAAPSVLLLAEFQEAYRVPPLLVKELAKRGSLPQWVEYATGVRRDWLASLHRAMTEKNWPEELKTVSAGQLESGGNLGMAHVSGLAATIAMPISTVSYLRAILDLLTYPFIPPNSEDPAAKMLLDGKRMDEAARRLEHIIGMVAETGFLDSPQESDAIGGAVTTGARFLYYHELAHLMRQTSKPNAVPKWIVPGEEYLAEELAADQLALSMIVLEFRSHPGLQPVAVSGVALALGFLAIKEFAEREYDGGKRRTKNATLRMSRILYWVQLSIQLGGLTEEALQNGKLFWEITRGLLARVERVPSPIFSLVLQTADRPEVDWPTASNHLVQWCAFGNRDRVVDTIRKIRDSALGQVNREARAQRVLQVIRFILKDTSHLEPTLGLEAALN